MNTCLKSAAMVAALALPGAASAATTFNVSAPQTQENIDDGGVYDTVLTVGDIASVDVQTAVDGDTDAALGFDYVPSNTVQRFQLSLNGFETGLYGDIMAYLSADSVLDPSDVVANREVGTGGFGGVTQDLFAESTFSTGRFFVLLDWENEADNSFSYDVAVSPAAVPVPAAGLMLLGAVGGAAALRRRKKS